MAGCLEAHPALIPPWFPIRVEEQADDGGPWHTLREIKNPATVGLLTREQWALARGMIIRFGLTAEEVKALPIQR
jgi:hypothetical protein